MQTEVCGLKILLLSIEQVNSSGKKFLSFEAEHYFEAEFGAKTHPDVKKVMEEIIPWIKQHFE